MLSMNSAAVPFLRALFENASDPNEVREYPYIEGDFLILGPQCFTLVDDQSVINYKGQNYTPQVPALSVRWHNCKMALHEWRRRRGSDYFEHPLTTALRELRGH
jgi:hypothetical protein